MTVAEQVISVFCGVNGHLDDIQQKDISKFEKDIIEICKSAQPHLINSIISSGKLEEDNEKKLTSIILDLKKSFDK